MKKVFITAIVLGMVMVFGIGSAFAASTGTSLKTGAFGFNVGYGNSVFGDTGVITLSGKYFAMNDLAITAGFGIQGSSGDVDANFFSFSAGVRKYLRIDDFAPFVEGKFTYATEKFTGAAGNVHQDAVDVSGVFGAEYFLHRQFSIEGSVGFGIGSVNDKNTNQDWTYFGTRTVGVSANFYF